MGSHANAVGDYSVALGTDSVAGDTKPVSVGNEIRPRRITHVAWAKQPGDAVNDEQFNEAIVSQAIQMRQNHNDIERFHTDVEDLQAGVAGSSAAASHQFLVGGDAPAQLSVAARRYRSESAVSLAFGAPVGNRVFVNANAIQDTRGTGATAQA